MKLLLVILFFIALVNAQVGDYSHFVGGSGSMKAGWKKIDSFTAWDTANSKFRELPSAQFGGGSVFDMEAVGTGVMVVGNFQSVNGKATNGIAYYNGTTWVTFPHLSLYQYAKVFPSDLSNPNSLVNPFPLPVRATSPGYAVGIEVFNNQVYIFGGNTGSGPSFNQLGLDTTTATTVGVAGLVRLNVVNNGQNFTIDNSLNYITRGAGNGGPAETNTNGFPADTAFGAPVTSSATKFRIGGTTTPFIYAGTSNSVSVWSPTWGSWVNLLSGGAALNISNAPTTLTINAPPNGVGTVRGWEIDRANNQLYVYGTFNNTLDTTNNRNYLHVARLSMTALPNTSPFDYVSVVTWVNSVQGFVRDGFLSGVFGFAFNNQNDYYVIAPYQDQSLTAQSNNRLRFVDQNRVFQVASGVISVLGDKFNVRPSAVWWNGAAPVLFLSPNTLYNQVFLSTDYARSHYTRLLSQYVVWRSNNWVDAYGGGLSSTSAPLVATNGNNVYMYNSGAASAYDVFSGGLFAYNNKKNVKRWYDALGARPTVRSAATTDTGSNGAVWSVHFLKSQRSGATNQVVVAGQFDWIGTQLLGSLAYLNADTIAGGSPTFESVGGGLWDLDLAFSNRIDQNPPRLMGGKVNKVLENKNRLYAGGLFTKNQNLDTMSNVAALNYKDNNAVWYGLSDGCNGEVLDLLVWKGQLYVGGSFSKCGGVPGTRKIAKWDEGKNPAEWKALGTGFPGGGSVMAIESYRGDLYVGGSFSSSPGSTRSGAGKTGLFRWDGDTWTPVLAACQKQCNIDYFSAPFQPTGNNGYDPADRAVNSVSSLRVYRRRLWMLGNNGGSNYLLSYDRIRLRQHGVATGAACAKQGCLARNVSDSSLNIVNFNEPGSVFNPNYQRYEASDENYADSYNGLAGTVNFVNSASLYTISYVIVAVILSIALF